MLLLTLPCGLKGDVSHTEGAGSRARFALKSHCLYLSLGLTKLGLEPDFSWVRGSGWMGPGELVARW